MSYTLLPLEMESPTPKPSRRFISFLRILKSRPIRSLCMTLGLLSAISTLLLWTSSPVVKSLPWIKQLTPDVSIPNRRPSPKLYLNEPSPPNWSYRQQAVKEAFLHAYTAYKEHAFPADEYFPLSGTGRQNFNGWGVTVVDSMDTMYLMSLHEEFNNAVEYVSTMTFDLPDNQYAHFFETVIRYLGGLLSAYALSKDPVLLQKADELGTKLLPAFNTKLGLPARGVQTKTASIKDGSALLAEIASCQLEYRYLAHLTGKDIYYKVANNINTVLEKTQDFRNNSMWSSHWDTFTGRQLSSHFSVGAWADSAYEYLLKQYLQTGKTEPRFKKMYMKAMQGIINNLVYLSPTRDLLYVTNLQNDMPSRKFEHLSCFFPGLLALGTKFLEADDSFTSESDIQLHGWVAEGIAYSCYAMYAESMSGMGADEVVFTSPNSLPDSERELPSDLWIDHFLAWKESESTGKPPGVSPLAHLVPSSQSSGERKDYFTRAPANYMRPETIESMYLMWKTTKDPIWRERGWEIFKSIERNCRLHAGYASIANVDLAGASINNLDDMPSFSLAETWKYLYLLFSPEDTLSLESWVFNTEAHPLPVFNWTEEERTKYRIRP